MDIQKLALVAVMASVPTLGLAGTASPPVTTTTTTVDRAEDREHTSAFAGLNWRFGAQSQGFEAVLGVIHARVEPNGDITGARGSVHFDLTGGGGTALRLTGFAGADHVVGEIGGGYDFGTGEPFGTAGILTNYANIGADYGFTSGWTGFVGITTYEFQEPDEDKTRTVTTESTPGDPSSPYSPPTDTGTVDSPGDLAF